ncbi:MAG: 4Fe-4S dicluster domain-containing protein [Coriobacteriia bacterium]
MVDNDPKTTTEGISRRDFVSGAGGAGVGLLLSGWVVKSVFMPDKAVAYPLSEGYIVVDTEKCSSCNSCMMACSLAHEGTVSMSNSRIQVVRDIFAVFPDDIVQHQCRQCPYPACVEACPTGANHVDTKNGNVRRIDPEKCIGCERCVNACPFTPSRVQWNAKEKHAQKCDLCKAAEFWDGEEPACVTVCPMKAIKYVKEVPVQGNAGYMVDLRTSKWGQANWSGMSEVGGE